MDYIKSYDEKDKIDKNINAEDVSDLLNQGLAVEQIADILGCCGFEVEEIIEEESL